MKRHAFDDLLPAYALGALTSAEQRRVRRHLASGCARCEARLAELAPVAAGLAFAAEEATPPAHIKAALMERVRPQSGTSWTWFPVWGRVLALASLACVVLWLAGRPGTGLRPPVSAPQEDAWVLQKGTVLADGHALSQGSVLPSGTELAVGPGGDASVRIGRQAILLMRANSRIRVPEQGRPTDLGLAHGTVLGYAKAGHAFGVQVGATTHVDAGGTVFLVRDVEPQAYVCVCLGKLRVTAPGLDRTLVAKTDEDEHAVRIRLAGGVARATDAKPGYYKDAEVDALRAALD